MKGSWLHLSDLHVGQYSGGLWQHFKHIFLEDLRRLSEETGPIDLVLFSGDLTQGGEKSQYTALTNELRDIWEMWDKLGQKPRLFTVPGNHDLEQPPEDNPYARILTNWKHDKNILEQLFDGTDNPYIELIQSAFGNYVEWQENIGRDIPIVPFIRGLLPGDISSSFNVNGVEVGLVGLNSSFLQLKKGNSFENLILDVRQLNAVTEDKAADWCERHKINFLITHHPHSWLSTDAQKHFKKEIYPSARFTAHLFGHVHDHDILTQYRGGDAGRTMFQSSSLFGLELHEDGNRRIHGYSIGQISFQGDKSKWKLWPRIGIVSRKSENNKIIPDHYNFDLQPGREYQSNPKQEEWESWTGFDKALGNVLKNITDDCFKPDLVVFLGRSGAVFGGAIAGNLQVTRTAVLDRDVKRNGQLILWDKISQNSIPSDYIKGKNVLLIKGEVCTGFSMREAKKKLMRLRASEVKLAAYYCWKASSTLVDYAGFYGEDPVINTPWRRPALWPRRSKNLP